jgi:hypothetical protein
MNRNQAISHDRSQSKIAYRFVVPAIAGLAALTLVAAPVRIGTSGMTLQHAKAQAAQNSTGSGTSANGAADAAGSENGAKAEANGREDGGQVGADRSGPGAIGNTGAHDSNDGGNVGGTNGGSDR